MSAPKPMIEADPNGELHGSPQDDESSTSELESVCPHCLKTTKTAADKPKRPPVAPPVRRDLVSSLTMISEAPELLQPEGRDKIISSLSTGSSQSDMKPSKGVAFHLPHLSEEEDEDDEEALPSLASFSHCDTSRQTIPSSATLSLGETTSRQDPGIAASQTARHQGDNNSSCDSTANVTSSSDAGSLMAVIQSPATEGLDGSDQRFQSERRSSLLPPKAPSRPMHLSSVEDDTSLDSSFEQVPGAITEGQRMRGSGVVLPRLPTLGTTRSASVPDNAQQNQPPRIPERIGSLGSTSVASKQSAPDNSSLRNAASRNRAPELPVRIVSSAEGSHGSLGQS